MNQQVDGSAETWCLILTQLYQSLIYPRPKVDISSVAKTLPALHKYNFAVQLQLSYDYIFSVLPDQLDFDSSSPSYVLSWLSIAEKIQLESLKVMCEEKIDSHFTSNRKVTYQGFSPKPCKCVDATGGKAPASGHGGGSCVGWCSTCRQWGCFHSARCSRCGETSRGSQSSFTYIGPLLKKINRGPTLGLLLADLGRETLENLLLSFLQMEPVGVEQSALPDQLVYTTVL